MMKGKITSLLAILAAVTCTVSAEITLEVVPIDNSSQLTGWVTQDLVVTTDTDWLSAQMIVTLDEPAGIFQDSFGNRNPQSPNPIFLMWPPVSPGLEFDTYVSNGVLGEPVSMLAAVDMGETVVVFDEDRLAILWFTDQTDDIGALALARVTLADTASGTWQFLATALPQGGARVDVPAGIIENGVMYIPEPATLGMLSVC